MRNLTHRALGHRPGHDCPSIRTYSDSTVHHVLWMVGITCGTVAAIAFRRPLLVITGLELGYLLSIFLRFANRDHHRNDRWEACGCAECLRHPGRSWWTDGDDDIATLLDSVERRHGHRADRALTGSYLAQLSGAPVHEPEDEGDRWRFWLARVLEVNLHGHAFQVTGSQMAALRRCLDGCGVELLTAGPLDPVSVELALRLATSLPLHEAVESAVAATGN